MMFRPEPLTGIHPKEMGEGLSLDGVSLTCLFAPRGPSGMRWVNTSKDRHFCVTCVAALSLRSMTHWNVPLSSARHGC